MSQGAHVVNGHIVESQSDKFIPNNFPHIRGLQTVPAQFRAVSETPIFSLCWILGASLVLLSGFFADAGQDLIKAAGVVLLILGIPVLGLERFVLNRKVRTRIAGRTPAIEEIRKVRSTLSTYLSELDRRTSRYFHCVTNTKVTTYFMLRQIENSLGEFLTKLDTLVKTRSAQNYSVLQELLKGSLEYRDGFEFNRGRIFHVPVHGVVTRIQELVTDLERGINALEEEIETYREQVLGPLGIVEEDRQLPLELGATPNDQEKL